MKNTVTSLLIRVVLYAVFVAALVHLISLEGFRDGTESKYSEFSLTEWLESGYAFISGVLFLVVARINRPLRPVAVMLASLCAMMVIRESDFLLDENVFDGAWQTLVAMTLILVSLYLWRHKGEIARSIQLFGQQPSAGIFLGGALTLFVFSRLFGRSSFWQAVMGDGYMRVVKNIAEEGTELMGYALISISALELLFVSIAVSRTMRQS